MSSISGPQIWSFSRSIFLKTDSLLGDLHSRDRSAYCRIFSPSSLKSTPQHCPTPALFWRASSIAALAVQTPPLPDTRHQSASWQHLKRHLPFCSTSAETSVAQRKSSGPALGENSRPNTACARPTAVNPLWRLLPCHPACTACAAGESAPPKRITTMTGSSVHSPYHLRMYTTCSHHRPFRNIALLYPSCDASLALTSRYFPA